MLKLENISKYYKTENGVAVGVQKVNLEFATGEFVALTGESGSGKSTLLNVMSGLDTYEEGELYINGEETSHFDVTDWEGFRSANIGFVFQSYNIIDSYTVLQNVMVALEVQGYDPKTLKQRALELIEKVGLTSHKHHKASKLSGGQKQRAVIARALAKDAPIIMADEPTGNLDSESGKQVMKLLHDISKDKLVIVVTHNYEQLKDYATRHVKMSDGNVVEDKKLKKVNKETVFKKSEPKNMSFKKMQRFALRNIFATPKKLFFSVLVQSVMIFLLITLFASQLYSIKSITNYNYNSYYDPISVNKVTVTKSDYSDFTDNEIVKISNINKDAFIPKYDNLLNPSRDYARSIPSVFNFVYDYSYSEDGITVNNVKRNSLVKTFPASIYNEKEVAGRLPKNINEIIILDNNYLNLKVGQEYEFFLSSELSYNFGIDMEFPLEYYENIGAIKSYKFKVVGKLRRPLENYSSSNIFLGFHNDIFTDNLIDFYANRSMPFRIDYEYRYHPLGYEISSYFSGGKNGINIIPTDKLTGREFSFNTSTRMVFVEFDVFNYTFKIGNEGRDRYLEDITYKDYFETFFLPEGSNLSDYQSLSELGINNTTRLKTTSNLGFYSDKLLVTERYSEEVIYVSEELYLDIVNTSLQQQSRVTILTKGIVESKQILKELTTGENAGVYIVEYNPAIEDFGTILESLILNVVLVVGMVVAISLSYAIIGWTMRSILNTRKRDFAIFRSIGANKKTMGNLLIVEQVMVTLMCYLIVVIGIITASVFSLQMSLFYSVLTPMMHIFVFMMLLLFSANMGRKFNKRIFKSTIMVTLG